MSSNSVSPRATPPRATPGPATIKGAYAHPGALQQLRGTLDGVGLDADRGRAEAGGQLAAVLPFLIAHRRVQEGVIDRLRQLGVGRFPEPYPEEMDGGFLNFPDLFALAPGGTDSLRCFPFRAPAKPQLSAMVAQGRMPGASATQMPILPGVAVPATGWARRRAIDPSARITLVAQRSAAAISSYPPAAGRGIDRPAGDTMLRGNTHRPHLPAPCPIRDPDVGSRIRSRCVGLQVQHGRAVEGVDGFHLDHVLFDGDDSAERQGDQVGPHGSPTGEYAGE